MQKTIFLYNRNQIINNKKIKMASTETVIKFDSVFFEYVHPKLILEDVKFNVRAGLHLQSQKVKRVLCLSCF